MTSSFVQAGPVRLQYFEHGEGPETIVLVHGYASNAPIWRYTVEQLTAAGRFRIIAFNNRGAGESGRSDLESDYSVESFAVDLFNAVDQLGLRDFTLVGHSMGGATVSQFSLAHQELLKALVLLNSAPLNGRTLAADWEEELRASFARGGLIEGDMGFNAHHVTRDFKDEVIGIIRRNPVERAIGGRRSMSGLRLRGRMGESRSRRWWSAATGTPPWGWTISSPNTSPCPRNSGTCTCSTASATRRTWKCRTASPSCWLDSWKR